MILIPLESCRINYITYQLSCFKFDTPTWCIKFNLDYFISSFRNRAVSLSLFLIKPSGVPENNTLPPSLPPSGPISMTQSAHLITSKLCSMIKMVLPRSTKRLITPINTFTSSKCKPVVGSSKI